MFTWGGHLAVEPPVVNLLLSELGLLGILETEFSFVDCIIQVTLVSQLLGMWKPTMLKISETIGFFTCLGEPEFKKFLVDLTHSSTGWSSVFMLGMLFISESQQLHKLYVPQQYL